MANQLPSGRLARPSPRPKNGEAGRAAFVDRRTEDVREQARSRASRGRVRARSYSTWRYAARRLASSGTNGRPTRYGRADAESTNLHNAERTRAFAERYRDRPLRSIDSLVVAEWLKGGHNLGTVPALRAMFNDARRPQAGMLIDANPFANLGLKRSKGRKHVQPPQPGEVARLIAAADELTPPSFAAYLFTACYSAMRPGELDALRWDDLDFTPDAESIRIRAPMERQGEENHAAKARLARDDRDGRAIARPLALAAARIRMGLHDAARRRTTRRRRARTIGTASAARSGSATSRSTRRRATTSRGTCSTCSSFPITWSRCSFATTTAGRSSASFTGTLTRRSRASASEPRSARRRS